MDFVKSTSGLLVPDRARLVGTYRGKIIRVNGDVEEFEDHNLIVNQGLNMLLAVGLGAVGQLTQWYLGIFQGNYSPVPTDTNTNWSVSATECSSYAAGVRPLWQQGGAAAQAIGNVANPAAFTFNASQTIYGGALVSNNVIGSVGGSLFSEALFGTPKGVSNGDQLLLTYTVSLTSA